MDSSFSLANVFVAAAITFFTLLVSIFFLFFYKNSRSHQENQTTTSSSSPPPLSSLPQNRKYHVFLSFHGPDVRRTLRSHILKKFESKGIHTFVDDDMERSTSIGPVLVEAIRGSRLAIVFLSKNYASSTWCLNELVEIMECREKSGQIVISLFHEVDPTDVKKQTGDFGKVFKKTCHRKTKDDITRWEKALEEVAKIAGYDSKNWSSEADMIEKIATDVSTKLNMSTPSSDFDDLVGLEAHMINMEQDLRLDLDEVRIIGILGLPGIGKTTLARYLFNKHFQDFQLTLFMDNIKRKYKIPAAASDEYSEKLFLQKEFMSQLTNEKDIMITHLGVVKDRLSDKKVLVVLDDVDDYVQLEALAGETSWFGPYSRIIVTTQDEKVLQQRQIKHIYKVDLPSPDDALQMFCMSAFRQKYPRYGFEELACEVTRLAGALPLGLRVLGSYFKEMTKENWTKELPSLMTRLNQKIERVLKFSYDALSDDYKSLFIHIACFFNDESVDIVEGCLTNSPFFSDVTLGLRVLVEKSLISMDSGNVRMHNLLVQLGGEIVRLQSVREPGKREFLYDARDIEEVLSDDQAGSSSVIGIDLNYFITCTSERAFERLSNLQFLRIEHCYDIDPQSLTYISRKLRLLSWRGLEMPCFPSSFHTKFLVKLDMPFSKLEKLWEGTQPLSNLKWVDLSYSNNLKELPDLSTATNLCELDLTSCTSLEKLHSSIGNAINLKKLNLNSCRSLVELPSSIDNLINLESLDLYSCQNLVEISCSMENATKLHHFDFDYCYRLVKLPSYIGNPVNLQTLNLWGCSSLVELPSFLGNAINLRTLYIEGCSSLVKLPSSIGNAINLKTLILVGCSSLVKLPSSIGNAINLETLNLGDCSSLVELPSSIGNAINLKTLDLEHCSSLVELPSSMKNLGKLKALQLKGCSKLEVVLTNINLETLIELDLSDCSLLKSDPETSTNIDPWIGRRSSLRSLVLSGMKMVTLPQLPDSIVSLVADNCESLERLDCYFRNPDVRLNFNNCFKLNQEARDLIIQTRTKGYAVLPGEEVPVCFTYRSSGCSLTVDLNETPLPTSTKFKVCIVLAGEDDEIPSYNDYLDMGEACGQSRDEAYHYKLGICCITSEQNARTACISKEKIIIPYFCVSMHLYIFEVEAVDEVTSTELVFEFDIIDSSGYIRSEIKECGVYQLGPKDGEGESLSRVQRLSCHDEAADLAPSD